MRFSTAASVRPKAAAISDRDFPAAVISMSRCSSAGLHSGLLLLDDGAATSLLAARFLRT